jgi:hypothetical protein
MFGDPREAILTDIHDYTLSTVGPLASGVPLSSPGVAAGFGRFSTWENDTLYLMLNHKDRVLFYGMDLSPPTADDILCMLSEADVEEDEDGIPSASRVTLFCRRKAKQSPFEVEEYFASETDHEIEDLDHIEPREGESNEDFFLRNAMWLLNPMVH